MYALPFFVMDDIRNLQITFQLLLIFMGYFSGYLEKSLLTCSVIILPAIITQYILIDRKKLGFNWKSPLISSLSLILILKSQVLYFWPLVSFVSIASKHFFKFNDKHFFNPSLVGILFSLIFLRDFIWLSPGAWGEELFVFMLFLISGLYLLFHIPSRVTLLSFLTTYFSFLALRMIYLGDPLHLYLHQVSNISFILFVFFMLSDPKTNPRSQRGQMIYGALVASFAYYFKFTFFSPYFLYYSLMICAFSLPIFFMQKRLSYV